ncbi:hypothetical protein [Herbidospora galbida]|uniref:hypothetical protein n=1 Tax=Herbidospora galbida TaxID=2575442 RepID=UPI001484FEE5|nr:hypothetical protein [Herbidospora galbida]
MQFDINFQVDSNGSGPGEAAYSKDEVFAALKDVLFSTPIPMNDGGVLIITRISPIN